MNSPRNDSLLPLVHMLAVSMKLPPDSRYASYNFFASSLPAPHPQSSPKVMAPSATSETRNPEFPSSLYFISPSSISLGSLSYRSQAAGSAITGFFWGPDFPPLRFPVFFV